MIDGADARHDNEKLWGGRFSAGLRDDVARLTTSLPVDIRLLPYDLRSTTAHAVALARAGLLEQREAESIGRACKDIAEELASGVPPGVEDEDVHSLVERLLTDKLGETGARVHAGRSRNDLVVTDLRLWCLEQSASVLGSISGLLDVIGDVAGTHTETLMPGYTHLQRAQPVSLGFHLLAHGFALLRDGDRFLRAFDAADVSALGAGAIAGTTLEIDPAVAASELGFGRLYDNAMDAVSQRDFACDFVYASALCGVHLSRLAEEIVLWTSGEFSFAHLPDDLSTGSSMMPQKRNPDLAELVRGRAAATIGDLTSLLALLKGLPLAYSRDVQEDKVALFSAGDRVLAALEATKALVAGLVFDERRLYEAAAASATWATDLAEGLVRRGVPFRAAHRATGRLVATLADRGVELADAPIDLLKAHHPAFEAADLQWADPRRGVEARSGPGGTAAGPVRRQLEALRRGADRLSVTSRAGGSI